MSNDADNDSVDDDDDDNKDGNDDDGDTNKSPNCKFILLFQEVTFIEDLLSARSLHI